MYISIGGNLLTLSVLRILEVVEMKMTDLGPQLVRLLSDGFCLLLVLGNLIKILPDVPAFCLQLARYVGFHQAELQTRILA